MGNPENTLRSASKRKVIVAGAGGNIGSHVVPLIARQGGVGLIILADPDIYEAKNAVSQNIAACDVGRPKATVQAQRLRQICPTLGVVAVDDRIETLPLGWFQDAVVLGCLDSRRSRRYLNEAVFKLRSLALIDAGVDAAGLQARVSVYLPGLELPCMECAWHDADYDAIEQQYRCGGANAPAAATNAPAALGALAASLQAIECGKVLAGVDRGELLRGELFIDARHHRQIVSTFRRNPACRLDHSPWQVERLDRSAEALRLGDALALGGGTACANGAPALRAGSGLFVRRLACPGCGRRSEPLLALEGRVRGVDTTCRACRLRMRAGAFDVADWLEEGELGEQERARSLASLGFRHGDVFVVRRAGEERHYEIAGFDSGE